MITVLITFPFLHSKKKPILKTACSATKPLPQAGKENKENNAAGLLNTSLVALLCKQNIFSF